MFFFVYFLRIWTATSLSFVILFFYCLLLDHFSQFSLYRTLQTFILSLVGLLRSWTLHYHNSLLLLYFLIYCQISFANLSLFWLDFIKLILSSLIHLWTPEHSFQLCFITKLSSLLTWPFPKQLYFHSHLHIFPMIITDFHCLCITFTYDDLSTATNTHSLPYKFIIFFCNFLHFFILLLLDNCVALKDKSYFLCFFRLCHCK